MKKTVLSIIRILLTIIALFFLADFVLPMFFGIINIGNAAGAFLCLWVLSLSIKTVREFLKKLFNKNRITHGLYLAVNICFAVFAAYGALVTGAMAYCAAQAPSKNATAIVLGAQVKDSGPSVMLWGRIYAAGKYLDETPQACAVLSGGQGTDEPISEAQSMYENLDKLGISTDRLYKEDAAVNTTENIKFSVEIIKENGLNENIAIVTDGFHQLRAKIITRQLGIKQNVGAVNSDTSFIYLPIFAVREWFALPYQLLCRQQ